MASKEQIGVRFDEGDCRELASRLLDALCEKRDQRTIWVSRVGPLDESQIDTAYDSVFAGVSLDDIIEKLLILHFDSNISNTSDSSSAVLLPVVPDV